MFVVYENSKVSHSKKVILPSIANVRKIFNLLILILLPRPPKDNILLILNNYFFPDKHASGFPHSNSEMGLGQIKGDFDKDDNELVCTCSDHQSCFCTHQDDVHSVLNELDYPDGKEIFKMN